MPLFTVIIANRNS